MKCIKCKEEFQNDSKICSNCGKNNNIANKILDVFCKMILYCLSIIILIFVLGLALIEKNIVAALIMIFALILIFPDTHRELSKKIKFVQKVTTRGAIIFVSIVASIIFLASETGKIKENTTNKYEIADNNSNNIKSEEENKDNANNNKSVIKDIKNNEISNSNIVDTNFDEAMIKQFIGLGFNIEEATEMQNLFYKMGITSLSNIKSATNDVDINKLVSFVAVANNDSKKKFYFTVENRKMFYAGFQDEDLYDSAKGGVLKNINDIHIPETKVTMSEYTTLQDLAKKEVKNYLNYPDSANFPLYDGWGVGRNDNKYKIIGKVEAKNGFGVKENINFSIWFIKENNNYTVEAVLIGGTRVK